jgi:hypothetical protein
MRVLYFLEPSVEFGDPLQRLPTLRNHWDRELSALRAHAGQQLDLKLVCAERVYAAARVEGLLRDIDVVTVSARDLRRVTRDAFQASLDWFEGTFAPATLARAMQLYAEKLGGFVPDAIVCYESSAPYLAQLFPRALLLHSTLGMFSRPPYPALSTLDPYGLGKHSSLAFAHEALRRRTLATSELAQLEALKLDFRRAQRLRSPVTAERVRQGFAHVVLLPLQVSRYFMYDAHCPPELRGKSQTALIAYVLSRVPRDVGVYASLHRVGASWAERRQMEALTRRHPNLLHDPEIQSLPFTSQHVLPHVDAVVSVASSVGLQALIWDLPVVVVGESHLTGVASATSLGALPALLARGRTAALDPVLYHLLTHYYVPEAGHHESPAWLLQELARGVAWHRAGRTGPAFSASETPEVRLLGLRAGLRHGRQARDLEGWLQRRRAVHALPRRELHAAMAQADVVSFGLFGALLARHGLAHAAFARIAEQLQRRLAPLGISPSLAELEALRAECELAAVHAAEREGREAAPLTAIHAQLVAQLGVPKALQAGLTAQLVQWESAAECAIAAQVAEGAVCAKQARNAGKRLVYMADSPYSAETLLRMIDGVGLPRPDTLYVSSEHGLTMRSGSLFAHARAVEDGAGQWLHVGTHPLEDEHAPDTRGIACLRLFEHAPVATPDELPRGTPPAAARLVRKWRKFRRDPAQFAADSPALRRGRVWLHKTRGLLQRHPRKER